MPTFDVEFSVECAVCGADLDADTGDKWKSKQVKVQPCPTCLEKAKQEGKDEAQEEAETDGD